MNTCVISLAYQKLIRDKLIPEFEARKLEWNYDRFCVALKEYGIDDLEGWLSEYNVTFGDIVDTFIALKDGRSFHGRNILIRPNLVITDGDLYYGEPDNYMLLALLVFYCGYDVNPQDKLLDTINLEEKIFQIIEFFVYFHQTMPEFLFY